MKLIDKAILASIGLVCAGTAQRAAAQTAPPPESESLQTIVVTAEKREEKLADVPMSVTALQGSALNNLQLRDFSDIAALVPGLSIASDQPGLTRLTLRGQNTGGDGSTVAVYMDESPFGSSAALSNGATNTGDFDTWDLQRIEVLRGPQGTLYGSNSEGGLLKYVTNAPELGKFSVAGELTGESIDHGADGGVVRGMLNLPMGDKVAFRVSGFGEDVPGYIDDPSLGKTDLNGGHKNGGRASLLFDPVDALSIRLTATSQRANYAGTNVEDVDPTTLVPVHGDLTQQRYIAEPSTFKYDNYNALIDWNVGAFTVVSSTSYGIVNTDTVSDFTSQLAGPGVTFGEALTGIFGQPLGARLDDNVETKKFTQEVRLASAASGPLEWLLGGYFTRETASLIEHLDAVSLPSGANPGLPELEVFVLDSTYKEYAGFGTLTYHFNPAFDLQGGLRYSKNEQTATQGTSGALVGPPANYSADSSGDVVTYSVAPSWHLNPNNMLYARIATGYRPGGPNVVPPGAPPDVPREYGADKTTNYELGNRSTLLNGALSVDLAAFYVRWTDVQLIEEVSGNAVNANGGTARSEGVEWTFAYTPVKDLTLQWIGAYTDAILTSPAPAVNAVSGDPLPYVPKWSTAIDASYSWAWFSQFRGFAGATWSYVDARSSDFGSSPTGTQIQVPSYNTYALRLGIDNDHYRVTLYGKNLSDSRGITNYIGSGTPGFNGMATVIQPRTIGLTLGVKF
jgi:outer membrane receptor protein involved in Fe transport